jgi:hemoglobin-like flavoprotein
MEKSMTPEQVQIIKLTFAQAMINKDQVGRIFYDRLFTIAPETRPLFKGDIDAQSRKLMDTLALAIGMLRDMPSLVVTLETLARRHVEYGVRDEHYDKVGDALMWTLQQGLGPAFTPEARTAWVALYGAVAQIMRNAASGKTDRSRGAVA